MKLRLLPFVLVVAGAAASADAGGPAASSATAAGTPAGDVQRARQVRELIMGLDFDEARAELAGADPDDTALAIERGRLAVYEADCDGAVATLSRPDVQRVEDGAELADIARGCARVTAATVFERDAERGIELRFQDEHDRALASLIDDTVVRARDALTRDLGVSWPRPTRVIVVDDLLSLSAMTGLPYKSAQTTGTVAVAKWGRVTLLSPRASHHGFVWRDTVAHELTHLAVTRATRDRAPLWLQEGVAKREEVRWREPGPFDDRPSPDAVVARGMELKLDIGLDHLGPSIAMLSSADAAMVAFAEVTSFVRYYADNAGPQALVDLLGALRKGAPPDEALRTASGSDLHAWDARWRAYVTSRPREPLPTLFGLGAEPAGLRELKENSRLAELLFGRDHPQEALQEIDKVKGVGVDDPSLRYLRARILERIDRVADAEPLVQDPKQVASPYGPWWAIRGRFARGRGDGGLADASFAEAVSVDPLDVEAACESVGDEAQPADPAGVPLCEAARARNEPKLGSD
jgi:peptidase MA superfamily protein